MSDKAKSNAEKILDFLHQQPGTAGTITDWTGVPYATVKQEIEDLLKKRRVIKECNYYRRFDEKNPSDHEVVQIMVPFWGNLGSSYEDYSLFNGVWMSKPKYRWKAVSDMDLNDKCPLCMYHIQRLDAYIAPCGAEDENYEEELQKVLNQNGSHASGISHELSLKHDFLKELWLNYITLPDGLVRQLHKKFIKPESFDIGLHLRSK